MHPQASTSKGARTLAHVIAWSLLALAPAACVVAPYPYAYSVPANYDQSFDAVVGAMADNGLTINQQDRGGGVVAGRRGGIDVVSTVRQQQDGTVRVEFSTRGAIEQDPGLIDRVTAAYNRRMGR
jgi:hypothetical protein